jgi:hypothetical protein
MAQEAYLIRVKGHLGQQWDDWFDGFTITNVEHGEAIISGSNVDQAALHGVLAKVRDLALPLLAVSRAAAGECLVAEERTAQEEASRDATTV